MFSVFTSEQDVINKLQELIETIANESITARGKFSIGFSGKKIEAVQVLFLINFIF